MGGEKGISAFPDGDNLFRWIGTIQGPVGTVKTKHFFLVLLILSIVYMCSLETKQRLRRLGRVRHTGKHTRSLPFTIVS